MIEFLFLYGINLFSESSLFDGSRLLSQIAGCGIAGTASLTDVAGGLLQQSSRFVGRFKCELFVCC